MRVASSGRRPRSLMAGLILASLFGCATADSGLDSWQSVGDAQWQVREGTIEATVRGSGGYLVSDEQFRNFKLAVEFWIEDQTNSGIFVRCQDPANINPDDCYEINIWDNHPRQEFRTGSIVKRQAPLEHVDTLGRWNPCLIDVRGNEITVRINGVVTARLEDDSLQQGYIALQYGGTGLVRFRHLRLYDN